MKHISETIGVNEERKTAGETQQYNVAVAISGVASVIVEASSPEEAKELAMKGNDWGSNDYYWWYDKKNPVVAVSTEDMDNPQLYDINDLKKDKNWMFV